MIDVKTIPMTDYLQIDDEHKEMVALLNKLYECISIHSYTNVSIVLSDIMIFTRNHFDGEEALMKKFSYPEYRDHKSEHTRILNNIQLEIINWRENEDYTHLKTIMEVNVLDWFIEHLHSVDSKLADFLQTKS